MTTTPIDPETRRDFVQDGQVQAKQEFDRERPAPRSIDPIPVEGRDGQEPAFPTRAPREYQTVHLLSGADLEQMTKTSCQSLDAQARALTRAGSGLIPELVQICALMHLAQAKPARDVVDRLVHELDDFVQQAAQLRNGLATHR